MQLTSQIERDMMNREKIVVVGSSNTDMTVKSKSLPRPGETVLGGVFVG